MVKLNGPTPIESRADELHEETSLSEVEAKIQARQEHGYTREEIADDLDVSPSHVSVASSRISEKEKEARDTATVLKGESPDRTGRAGTILPEDARPRDGAQLFLAPCVNENAQRHFQDTVVDGVDVETPVYRPHIHTRYTGTVPIWGTGDGNASAAEAMESGDVILFYVGENRYSHFAVVQEVEKNPELAEALWTPYGDTIRKDETENWPWVMYLGDPVEVAIDSETLHDTLGWSRSYPLGFTRVGDGRVDRVRAEYGSIEEYLGEVLARQAVQQNVEVPTIDMSVESDVSDSEPSSAETDDSASLDELRERAEASAQETVERTETTTTRYSRAQPVKEYALARAAGECEACGAPAPFEKPDGTPYLEVHHLFRVSDSGVDDPDSVAAICPTCHRRIHYGADGNEYNRQLIEMRQQRDH